MIKRRNEAVMMKLILDIAKNDNRIRAAIMNGSRSSPSSIKDHLQDYDIIYVVTDVEAFVNDKLWHNQFGERIIMQRPDEIDGIWPDCKDRYAYLMLFTDKNRIDLTLINQQFFPNLPRDSQSILLIDKDNRIKPFDPPSDKDYLPEKPSEKKFQACCNEFFWVTTTLAKGICRKQLTYTKYLYEHIVQNELLKLLTWHAAIKTDFEQTIGAFGKYLQKYLEPEIWDSLCKTYVDADYDHIWEGLFEMLSLFHKIALQVSRHFHFSYDEKEFHAVMKYLNDVRFP